MKDLYQLIPDDKRENILQASMQEFATKGYEQASTNLIIQEAKISKGLLFHYFKSKKNLFLATLDTCIDRLVKQLLVDPTELPSDFFARLLFVGRKKLELFYERPTEYLFIMGAFSDPSHPLLQEIQERYQQAEMLSLPYLSRELDVSEFRPEVDPDTAIRLILMSLQAIGNQWMVGLQKESDRGLSMLDEAMKDMEQMIDILKHGVYKTE